MEVCQEVAANNEKTAHSLHGYLLNQWFLTLSYSGVFELQVPETPASTAGGEDLREWQSKNTWVTYGWKSLI